MGAAFTIYNLYELIGGSHQFLLAKVSRPAFSNADQPGEDAADASAEQRSKLILESQKSLLGFDESRLIGTWEDAYPEGDIFYSDDSGVSVQIWYSTERNFGRHIVFGIATCEDEFWSSIRSLHEEGELWEVDAFSRPAKHETVWLVKDSKTIA